MKKRLRVKPSKGQSIAGFIAGLFFCALGFVVVIPFAGLFGVFWTLIAIAITVVNAVNIWSKNGIATHEITIDDDGNSEGWSKSVEERLTEVRQLYEKGLITMEEYEEKRRELLDRI